MPLSHRYSRFVPAFVVHLWSDIKWRPYRPLFIIVFIVTVASIALRIEAFLSWIYGWFSSDPSGITGTAILQDFMHAFMGLMFLQFGMFKLFDWDGFVAGFKKYDLFAQNSDSYAYAYPLIEIALGFAYLSFFIPVLTYAITMIVMAVSGYSVLLALRRGLDVRCACLGTILDVPLSTVSVVENVAMGTMATLMLLAAIY